MTDITRIVSTIEQGDAKAADEASKFVAAESMISPLVQHELIVCHVDLDGCQGRLVCP